MASLPLLLLPALLSAATAPAGGAGTRLGVDAARGVPRLLLNGKPFTPFAFFYNSDIKDWRASGHLQTQVRLSRAAGVHLYSMSFRTPRTRPQGRETNWERCDRYMDAFIELDPDAVFLLRMYPGPNWSWREWNKIHPDQMVLYADGSRGRTSLASDWFWDPTDEDLARIIRHYEHSRYADRILIYEVGGPNIEMFHDKYRRKGPDYSPMNQARFRQWLAEKYPTDRALQEAWARPLVSRSTAAIPTFEPGRFPMRMTPESGTIDVFYDLPSEQDWVDFSEYANELVADRLLAWARLIRRETGARKLSLFFYGYTFELPGSFSGHYNLARVLRSPDVDILAGPYSYVDRDVGGAGSFMCPIDSIAAHGKLWFNEDDTRTYRISEETARKSGLSFHGTGGLNVAESIGVLERNIGALRVHRAATWWMDLISRGAFGDKRFWKVLVDRRATFEELYRAPLPYRPEIAVLVDEESKLYVKSDYDANRCLLQDVRAASARSGASVGYYLLDDFLDTRVPRCKAYVFVNAFQLDDSEITAIRERLAREKATAVWAYAPAYVGPEGFDIDRSRRLTGLSLKRRDGRQGSEGAGRLAGRNWARTVGVKPRFVVKDPGAETLGRYRSDGAVSAAQRDGGGFRSVFFGDMGLTPGVLRVVFEQAGAHIWTRGSEVVRTDGTWLIVHSGRAGSVPIRLPAGVRFESGAPGERDGNEVVVPFEKGQTRWFRLLTSR